MNLKAADKAAVGVNTYSYLYYHPADTETDFNKVLPQKKDKKTEAKY